MMISLEIRNVQKEITFPETPQINIHVYLIHETDGVFRDYDFLI